MKSARGRAGSLRQLALATHQRYKTFMSKNVRQRNREQPAPNQNYIQIEVPPGEILKVPDQTPPASTSQTYEIKSKVTTTPTTATSRHIMIHPMPATASPVDPIEIVEYESWMFFQTANLALNHLDEYPNIVIRNAIVENAVLHARSLCEVIISSGEDDLISLHKLFSDFNQNEEKYKALRAARKQLIKEYRGGGRNPSYEKVFNTRVMHPTVLRGNYGLYEEPLRRLQPKILAVVRKIAALAVCTFRIPTGN